MSCMWEAKIFYKWCNFIMTTLAMEKPLILINMDETSIAYSYGGQKGNIILRLKQTMSDKFIERLSLGDRRSFISYVASICNPPSYMEALPQILLGNHARFTNTLMEQATEVLPKQVILWRESSHWLNSKLMCQYIKTLAAFLGEAMKTHNIILFSINNRCMA